MDWFCLPILFWQVSAEAAIEGGGGLLVRKFDNGARHEVNGRRVGAGPRGHVPQIVVVLHKHGPCEDNSEIFFQL